MTTLTEFLLARFADDEAVARKAASAERPRGGWGSELGAAGQVWETRPDRGMLYVPTIESNADAALWDDEGGCDYMAPAPLVAAHIARHDPARVLAECGAKRQIVESVAYHIEFSGDETPASGDLSRTILRALALPYADHEDFREEWRP